ncbi:MAG: LacI family DNA-binding transcriptional regulator [Opitutales bacterium]|nr:LacI family DNA-binding transcriptional regulator [Opitutales bacterium]
MKRPVTQRDLAERVGLSQAAVSMALRGDPRIRPSIREQVLAAAAELGYRPDPVLGALARYRRETSPQRYIGTVACLLPCSAKQKEGYLRSPFAADSLRGAEEGLAAMGYRCERFVLGAYSPDRLRRVLCSRGIRGMVIGPVGTGHRVAPPVCEELAVVQIGRGWPELSFHHVTTNHFENMLTVCRSLRARGYRRIGLLCRRGHEILNNGRWIAAYRYCMGMDDSPGAGPLPECTEPDALASWIRKYHPDAIIGSDVWLRSLLGEMTGLQAPRDVGFASLSVPGTDNPISGILQQPAEIGRTAARQIDVALRNHGRGPPADPVTVVLRGRWHEGTTVRATGVACSHAGS